MAYHATIADAKAAVDLPALVEAAGVELRAAGSGRLRGPCPFHAERTPSFFVFVDRRRFHCFGCGEHGDSIDFIRRARGCSFLEALSILGMDSPQRTAAELARIRAERRRREAERWREHETARTLGVAIRVARQALDRITPETLDDFALVLSELSILEFQHLILIHGDPAERAELVRELAGLRLLPRRLLFRRGFDFRAWSCGINHGATENDRRPGGKAGNPVGASPETPQREAFAGDGDRVGRDGQAV